MTTDIWIVVAAASAAYISKQWEKFLRHRKSSSESYCGTSDFEKLNPESTLCLPEKKSSPLGSLSRRGKLDKDISIGKGSISRGEVSEMTVLDSTPSMEVGDDNPVNLGNHKDGNVLSFSSLATGFLRSDNIKENEDGNTMTGDIDGSADFAPEPSTGCSGPSLGLFRKRRALRTAQLHAQFPRPISSLESCLLAQLFSKHAEMEEYVLSSLQSPPAPTVRPLFSSDGSSIINRESGDLLSMQIGTGEDNLPKEDYLEGKEPAIVIPSLPKLRPMEIPRKIKLKTGRGLRQRLSSSSKMVHKKHFYSQGGSPDGMILFCLGISIGMILSQVSNKKEVDKMKDLLLQTENLVQDLQEELEMKDSLTVKELANEDHESQDTHDNAFGCEVNEDYESQDEHDHICNKGPPNRFSSGPCDLKAEENSELMSKIEAELEAELEMLELSMNSSCLERRLSDLVGLDPDIVADVVQGELRVEMVGEQTGDHEDSNQDVSSTSTTHSANHAVSPRELSLRLHEVLQSRLEERVKELEIQLQNSERRLQSMDPECWTRYKGFANSAVGSSGQETTISVPVEENNPIAQPSVVNFSEDAYLEVMGTAFTKETQSESEDFPSAGADKSNHDLEVRGEFTKETQSESEDFPSAAADRSNHEDEFHQLDGSVLCGHEGLLKVTWHGDEEFDENGLVGDSKEHLTIYEEKQRGTFTPEEVRTLEDLILMDREMSGGEEEEDDDDDDYDDDEMTLLIQQIVEKSRKGSPMVLNAQRALFSVNENEP